MLGTLQRPIQDVKAIVVVPLKTIAVFTVNAATTTTTTATSMLRFYHASICEGGFGSRNSVCLSVRLSHAWIVTKLNDALQIFLYHTKGQSLCYSDTKSGWSATPPSL